MKWRVTEQPTPKAGDTRQVTHYAWMPKRLGGVKIWLSQWVELQVWEERIVPVAQGGDMVGVKVGQWVTLTQKPVKWIAA